MTDYQQQWHYFSSAQLVPEAMRSTCESWYAEMISAQPMHQYIIESVSSNIPEEYAYLLTA